MTEALSAGGAARYDLVLAADVLVYVGDVEPLFRAAHGALRRDGLFAFTTQGPEEGDGFGVGSDLRFHHAAPYIRRMAAAAGFAVLHMSPCAVRQDAGRPAAGHAVVLGRTDD